MPRYEESWKEITDFKSIVPRDKRADNNQDPQSEKYTKLQKHQWQTTSVRRRMKKNLPIDLVTPTMTDNNNTLCRESDQGE